MLHVLTKDGKKLFSGSRHDVKQYLRKNKVKNYVLKERFVEKTVVTEEFPKSTTEEEFINLEEYLDE